MRLFNTLNSKEIQNVTTDKCDLCRCDIAEIQSIKIKEVKVYSTNATQDDKYIYPICTYTR